jgi:hypothetical protein
MVFSIDASVYNDIFAFFKAEGIKAETIFRLTAIGAVQLGLMCFTFRFRFLTVPSVTFLIDVHYFDISSFQGHLLIYNCLVYILTKFCAFALLNQVAYKYLLKSTPELESTPYFWIVFIGAF